MDKEKDQRLKHLEAKYGPDFLKKAPLYKTATWFGDYVKLVAVIGLRAVVQVPDGHVTEVSLLDLDNFVL